MTKSCNKERIRIRILLLCVKIAQWANIKRIRRPFKKAAAVLNIRIGGSGYAAPFHISQERSYSHPVLLASVLAIVDRLLMLTIFGRGSPPTHSHIGKKGVVKEKEIDRDQSRLHSNDIDIK